MKKVISAEELNEGITNILNSSHNIIEQLRDEIYIKSYQQWKGLNNFLNCHYLILIT